MTFQSGPKGPFAGLKNNIGTAIESFFPRGFLAELSRRTAQVSGILLGTLAAFVLLSLISFSPTDPSLNTASLNSPQNWMGAAGAITADLGMQSLGFVSYLIPLFLFAWAWSCLFGQVFKRAGIRWCLLPLSLIFLSAVFAALPITTEWTKPLSAGGAAGQLMLVNLTSLIPLPVAVWAMIAVVIGTCLFGLSLPLNGQDLKNFRQGLKEKKPFTKRQGRTDAEPWGHEQAQATIQRLNEDQSLFEYNDPAVVRQIMATGGRATGYVPDAERDDRVSATVVTQSPMQSRNDTPNGTLTDRGGHDDASDFEGAAYGATRYEMNFGNEAVNWSGLSSFTEVAASPSEASDTPILRNATVANQTVPEWTPETWQQDSGPASAGPATKEITPSSSANSDIEPERHRLTTSFVDRLRAEQQRRTDHNDSTSTHQETSPIETITASDQQVFETVSTAPPDSQSTGDSVQVNEAPNPVPPQADLTNDVSFDTPPPVASQPESTASPADISTLSAPSADESLGTPPVAADVIPETVSPASAPSTLTPSTPSADEQAVAPATSLGHAASAVDQQLGGALAANRDKQIRIEKKSREALQRGPTYDNWTSPTVEYLDLPDDSHIVGLSEEQIADRIAQLENALAEFNVKGEVLRARPGPVVTLFEFQPAPGTRISRIVSLSDDIKRAMASASCRIAVVPETTLIGIELPNKQRTPVNLRQIIDSDHFQGAQAKLPLAMGIDISGQPVIGDLARCPHLLIAGTTGAGKSVSLNGMIMSMLYKLPPDQLKMIMIDPKMLELSIYDKIPHLLSPVVTDPRKAIVALKWAVREMEERYATMMTLQVRGIVDYNERIQKAVQTGEVLTRQVQTGFNIETGKPEFEEQELPLKPMPYIVCIIDELADLMELAKKEIEGSLQRLTQMGRAAGIHVITATQRPSVDVITGVIKANIPSRVSLYVRSKTDSRIVLDEQGAEQLLRVGDMLYSAEGRRPSRVHSGFVSTDEVLAVVEHLKAQAEPEYIDAIQDDGDNDGEGGGDLFGDYASDDGSGGGDSDLYRQAVRIVCQDRRASTSYIQRKLQIGYNRAARLIEQMENEGIVGPADKVGRRDILVGTDD